MYSDHKFHILGKTITLNYLILDSSTLILPGVSSKLTKNTYINTTKRLRETLAICWLG